MMIPSVDRKSLLKDKIYAYVAENVQNGVFTPGIKICEDTIASSLKVSRTPVREALTQLAYEGIVEKIPRRGFFVTKVDRTKSVEVFEVIGHLDMLVAQLAHPHLDETDYKKMRELIAKMDLSIRFENYADYSKNQNEFHEAYASKCPNKTLVSTLNSLMFSHIPHTYTGSGSELFEHNRICNKEHEEMLTAFQGQDLQHLGEIVKDHWCKISNEKFI